MNNLPRLSDDPSAPFSRVLATLLLVEPSPAWFGRGRLQSRIAGALQIKLHPEVSEIFDALIDAGALSVRWRHFRDGRRATLLVDRAQLRAVYPDFDPAEQQVPRLVVKPFAAPAAPTANRHTEEIT